MFTAKLEGRGGFIRPIKPEESDLSESTASGAPLRRATQQAEAQGVGRNFRKGILNAR